MQEHLEIQNTNARLLEAAMTAKNEKELLQRSKDKLHREKQLIISKQAKAKRDARGFKKKKERQNNAA